LSEVAHLDARSETDLASVWVGRARDHLEQSAFPRPVDAHDTPALPASDQHFEILIQSALAVCLIDAVQTGDIFARPRRLSELELDDLSLPRGLNFLDLF
jgi:hypothetical protein